MKEGPTIPIARVELSEDEISAAEAVLRSGRLRQGAVTAEFEKKYAAHTGAQHAVAVSSGTAALHLAWMAVLKPGDEVLVPAFTFVATATMVMLAGGKPVLCDVDPHTFTLDVEDARRRVTPRTVGIAPVHLYGQACDVAGVRKLADEHGLRIVWDAAQAHGTTVHGADVGSLGEVDMTCYSFYPTKNMTTGEGGMITTNDAELAAQLGLLRSHGQARKYYHTVLGLNYRTTDVHSAIGLVQLERLPQWVGRRRENAQRLNAGLSGVEGVETPRVLPGTEHAYHQYTILVPDSEDGTARDGIARRMQEGGVETGVHYPRPLHHQPVLQEDGDGELPSLPVSERLARTVLSLPVHPALSEADLDVVAQVTREAVAAR